MYILVGSARSRALSPKDMLTYISCVHVYAKIACVTGHSISSCLGGGGGGGLDLHVSYLQVDIIGQSFRHFQIL